MVMRRGIFQGGGRNDVKGPDCVPIPANDECFSVLHSERRLLLRKVRRKVHKTLPIVVLA